MAANNITFILIYAVLEWTLIILLLLNSIFSYFIIKFTQYFGLHPPCFLCARIDRFQSNLCNHHSKEISRLKLCSNHNKLAELHDMCENCKSSDLGFQNKSRNFVFSKVERIDSIRNDEEDEVECSCCGLNFERKLEEDESNFFVIDSNCDDFDDSRNGKSISDHIDDKVADDRIESNFVEENQETGDDLIEAEEHETEVSTKSNPIEDDLISFKLLAPEIEEHLKNFEDEDHEFGEFQKALMDLQEYVETHENLIDFGSDKVAMDEETRNPLIETEELQEIDSDSHSVHEEQEEEYDEDQEFGEFPKACMKSQEINHSINQKTKEIQYDDSDSHSVYEEQGEEEDEVVSIGAQIPVLDSGDEIILEDPSTISDSFHSHLENEEIAADLKNLSVKIEENEEDESPNTPSGIYSPNPFHKRWLIGETEDSIDTTEKLKSALESGQKVLRDLYMELEEERNASAVAANETMAMITRLQEEKAAMQMEALQYQRMMEEQSEYDQEALEFLNELMMKKEMELESYKKKVLDYQEKENIRVLKCGTKLTSSMSWSHSEDDEGSLSIDLHHVPKYENAGDQGREIQDPQTPADTVFNMETVLADFEEERVSILGKLRFLEERLVVLSDQEDQRYANVRVVEDHYEEINNIGTTNGYLVNEKQTMGKQLLPLFDATSNGVEDDVTVRNGNENGFHPLKIEDTAVTRFELEKKRIDMEDEIYELYGRLQALEGNREFSKRCIVSMKKGDKGMKVLQEILHLLRDLREVNFQAKSYTENVIL